MNIPVSTAKRIREELQAKAVVILTHDGEGDHLATHGETPRDADSAAWMGNRIKELLQWPKELCEEKPLARVCQNCRHWDSRSPSARLNLCHHEAVGGDTGDSSITDCDDHGLYTGPLFGCCHFDPK